MSHQRPRRTSNRSSSSRTSGPSSRRLISTHDRMLTDQVPREEAKETHRWFFPPLEKKEIESKGKGGHGKSRYERTGGAGLLAPGPEEHPTDHPTTDGTKLRGNAIGRDKSSLSSTTESLPGLFHLVHGKKSIGHPTKSWILETWVDSLVGSIPSARLALTVFHVDSYSLLFRFFYAAIMRIGSSMARNETDGII